ncbi:MAG: hypothetical protein NZ610_05650 [Candidatus Bipolaricaulota bacterium]|nr:hypothetical protein [Candidatus Bipolaricaulota bacterium]MCS7274865.1 hypothetical protein [Candidatus Bipolaricaulota bacterium]MDW8111144.1 hypothetical protein [Candidatus Bipolaricaulota bacterium]MDW8329596.1 hypothetical protein [Candidatus Bipolaricaulota bacterium]
MKARRSIAHDPLAESEIMKAFYKPSAVKNAHEPGLVKATFYLAPEDIIALEELQLQIRKREGRKANKSELMREAIALLVKEYSK